MPSNVLQHKIKWFVESAIEMFFFSILSSIIAIGKPNIYVYVYRYI